MKERNTAMRSAKEIKEYATTKECKTLLKEFKSFYTENYLLNDFSVASVYTGDNSGTLKTLTQLMGFFSAQLSKPKAPVKAKSKAKA